jgi:vacuolar-type H+-ATPase subunit F/Vma7
MSKIALLGPSSLTEPLKACGIEAFACDSGPAGSSHLKALFEKREHAVVFITERLAREFPEEIAAAEEKELNVVLLPDHHGSLGMYKEKLKGLIHD